MAPLPQATALITFLILAASLRFYNLSSGCLGVDEGFMLLMAKHSVAEILSLSPYEANPPLGPLVYKLWGLLFGDAELNYELLSVCAALLSIYFCYYFCAAWFGTSSAILAVLFLSANVMHLQYSQSVRAYSIAVLFGLLSAGYFLKWLTSAKGAWPALFFCWLFLNLHYYAFMIVSAFFLYGFCTRRKAVARSELFRLAFILLCICLPSLYLLGQQLISYPSFQGIPSPSLGYIASVFNEFHSNSLLPAAILPGLVVFGLYRGLKEKREVTAFLALWLALPFVIALSGSFFGHSFFLPRYFVLVLLPYLMLAGFGLNQLPSGWLRAVLALAVVIGTLPGLGSYFSEQSEGKQVKAALEYATTSYQAGDLMVHTLPFSYVPALYYHRNLSLDECLLSKVDTERLFSYWYDKDPDYFLKYWEPNAKRCEFKAGSISGRLWLISFAALDSKVVNGALQKLELAADNLQIKEILQGHLFLIKL